VKSIIIGGFLKFLIFYKKLSKNALKLNKKLKKRSKTIVFLFKIELFVFRFFSISFFNENCQKLTKTIQNELKMAQKLIKTMIL